MIDLGVSKLALIAVVALIVVGPERLPKVARMAGNLFGRAQRYMAEVRTEVNRQIELDEFKKLREASADAMREMESTLNATVQEANVNLSDQAEPNADEFPSSLLDSAPDVTKVYRDALRQGRDSWGVKRTARPLWYKHSAGVRTRVQSGAARVKRFKRPSLSK
jgi:sec-independent protein translocase protein TatB